MFRKQRLSLAALGFALTAMAGAGALAAAAQNPPPAQNRPAQDARPDFRDSRLEGRLAYLKSELRITAAQTRAWDAYADAIRADARERFEARQNPPPERVRARPSVVDTLAARSQRLEAANARLTRILAALRPLYAALSEDQRRMADRVLSSDDYGPPPGVRMRFSPPFAWDGRFGGRFYR